MSKQVPRTRSTQRYAHHYFHVCNKCRCPAADKNAETRPAALDGINLHSTIRFLHLSSCCLTRILHQQANNVEDYINGNTNCFAISECHLKTSITILIN